MEFELTLRGNTQELSPLLEFLAQTGGSFKEPGTLNVTESDIATRAPWKYGLQELFWNNLSAGAKVLMMHLCMRCVEGELHYEYVCNPDGMGHDGLASGIQEYCDFGVPCENPWDHRTWENVDSKALEITCKIRPQSLGARIANIARTMANPAFADQTSPVEKTRTSDDQWQIYRLTGNWHRFVFLQWLIANGEGGIVPEYSFDDFLPDAPPSFSPL